MEGRVRDIETKRETERGRRKEDGDSGRKPPGFTIVFNINKSGWVQMLGKREGGTDTEKKGR